MRFTASIALLEKKLPLDKPVNLEMAYHYIYGKWQESSNNKIIKTIPAFVAYEHFSDGFKEEYALIHVPLMVKI